MELVPTTTADTTAELGCGCSQIVSSCVCHLIRPVTDQRGAKWYAIPMLPGPCCHHGAQAESLPTPWTVFTPYRPNGSYPCFFYDRQGYFQRSAVAGKHHRPSKAMRKDTERDGAFQALSNFSCLPSFEYSTFIGRILPMFLRGLPCAAMAQSVYCVESAADA